MRVLRQQTINPGNAQTDKAGASIAIRLKKSIAVVSSPV